ncbi:MAG: glycosyltransferase, partial [Dehalococcoidia bacterium]|nr:glycosyltransferase [Dehalococcoidia bacterium]
MSISLVMIVRNAAATIERCLASVIDRPGGPMVQEAVAVLGGTSTDDTRGIVERFFASRNFPAKILDLPSDVAVDENGGLLDFAAARNFAHANARMQWALWLDSDDVVPAPDGQGTADPDGNGTSAMSLEEFLASLPPNINSVYVPYHYTIEPVTKSVLVSEMRERIVRWGDGFTWRGLDPAIDAAVKRSVHEHLVPVPPNEWRSVQMANFWIEHWPDKSAEERMERNYRILQDLHDLADTNWRVAYYIGQTCMYRGQFDKAIEYFGKAEMCGFGEHEKYMALYQSSRAFALSGRFREAERLA